MLINLGDVLVAQGKLQQAVEDYQQDLAIMKRLAEQDKTNSCWQRDLSVSYERVGDVLGAVALARTWDRWILAPKPELVALLSGVRRLPVKEACILQAAILGCVKDDPFGPQDCVLCFSPLQHGE
jgi:hypothetical protein